MASLGNGQAGSQGMLRDKRAQDSWTIQAKLIKVHVWLIPAARTGAGTATSDLA